MGEAPQDVLTAYEPLSRESLAAKRACGSPTGLMRQLRPTDENQVPPSTLARSRSGISRAVFTLGGVSRARRDRCLRSLHRAAGWSRVSRAVRLSGGRG